VTYRVLGRRGLLLEAVQRCLENHADPDAGTCSVLVLVDPEAGDWHAAGTWPAVLVVSSDGAPAIPPEVAAPVRALSGDVACADVLSGLARLRGDVLLHRFAAEERAARPPAVTALTKREADVLDAIGRGLSVKQTAYELGVAAKTVENVQGRLFRKLGVRNRAQAISRAFGLDPLGADLGRAQGGDR
jgi:DNA-binding CsgD family transcriptional regulator